MVVKVKKPYIRPELERFGTVTELTLHACNIVSNDGTSCRSLGDEGRTTPGTDNNGGTGRPFG